MYDAAAFDHGAATCSISSKDPFASVRVLAHLFLTSVPTIKEILQRELGLTKISRR
jgi:hypothetical protein